MNKNIFILRFLHFMVGLALATSETYMITRTKTGEIIKTDLTKNNEKDWNSNSIDTLRIIKRSVWLSEVPLTLPDELDWPVRHVVIMTDGMDICTTEKDCTYRVRVMQDTEPERLIPFNFLIGGDGNVYEGRGWDYKGAHPNNDFSGDNSISVVYLGTVREEPTAKQVQTARTLLSKGVSLGKLITDYVLHAAFDMNSASKLPETNALICSENSFKPGCSQLNG